MGLMAIYATFVMGSDLAKSYGLDSVQVVLSLGTFFMLQVPVNVLTPEEAPLGWVLPMSSLGASGMFAGILSMILQWKYIVSLKSKYYYQNARTSATCCCP